jgi:hypothetical protein
MSKIMINKEIFSKQQTFVAIHFPRSRASFEPTAGSLPFPK